jgi:tetratricopeptide (TPR) repeat protein
MALRLSRLARQWAPLTAGKELFTNLWSKPETRDERVKEYVPEVLEESLTEQRRVLAEGSSRDVIVDSGHKILALLDNKAPTPSITPHLEKILAAFETKELIGQRALSQLLYPTAINASTALGAGSATPNELVSGFAENFKSLVEYVEQNGRTATPVQPKADTVAPEAPPSTEGAEESTTPTSSSKFGDIITAPRHEVESLDATLFVKLSAGMALANIGTGDLVHASKCVDAGLKYAIDPKRIGGLYGMKAGILNRQRRFEEAANAARLAIEASDNIQGYLQGAASLKALNRSEEIVALLEQAREAHPQNVVVSDLLIQVKKTVKLSLPEGNQPNGAEVKELPLQ